MSGQQNRKESEGQQLLLQNSPCEEVGLQKEESLALLWEEYLPENRMRVSLQQIE